MVIHFNGLELVGKGNGNGLEVVGNTGGIKLEGAVSLNLQPPQSVSLCFVILNNLCKQSLSVSIPV